MALPLLEAFPRPRRLIADKLYNVMSLRRWLKRQRIKALIPCWQPAPPVSARPQGLFQAQCDRAFLGSPQELATHRPPV